MRLVDALAQIVGLPLMMVCPDCGSDVPVAASVCHACTADLAPPTVEARLPNEVD